LCTRLLCGGALSTRVHLKTVFSAPSKSKAALLLRWKSL
jgi:hypothetical protein